MHVRNYKAILYESGRETQTVDALSVEAPLQICINGTAFSITMRTPGDDEKLVRGLLHSEGIVRSHLSEIHIERCDDDNEYVAVYDVQATAEDLEKGYANSRSLLSVASCGICGKTELEDLRGNEELHAEVSIDPADIPGLFEELNRSQTTFNRSGGSHAAAAFGSSNELLCSYEDIGRHNAVDKVVGDLIMSGRFGKAKTLIVSGRVSYEIVVKCFKARIPILASVSAPSTLAVDYAKELGITLFSFCRENRATCYSNIRRIAKESGSKAV